MHVPIFLKELSQPFRIILGKWVMWNLKSKIWSLCANLKERSQSDGKVLTRLGFFIGHLTGKIIKGGT